MEEKVESIQETKVEEQKINENTIEKNEENVGLANQEVKETIPVNEQEVKEEKRETNDQETNQEVKENKGENSSSKESTDQEKDIKSEYNPQRQSYCFIYYIKKLST